MLTTSRNRGQDPSLSTDTATGIRGNGFGPERPSNVAALRDAYANPDLENSLARDHELKMFTDKAAAGKLSISDLKQGIEILGEAAKRDDHKAIDALIKVFETLPSRISPRNPEAIKEIMDMAQGVLAVVDYRVKDFAESTFRFIQQMGIQASAEKEKFGPAIPIIDAAQDKAAATLIDRLSGKSGKAAGEGLGTLMDGVDIDKLSKATLEKLATLIGKLFGDPEAKDAAFGAASLLTTAKGFDKDMAAILGRGVSKALDDPKTSIGDIKGVLIAITGNIALDRPLAGEIHGKLMAIATDDGQTAENRAYAFKAMAAVSHGHPDLQQALMPAVHRFIGQFVKGQGEVPESHRITTSTLNDVIDALSNGNPEGAARLGSLLIRLYTDPEKFKGIYGSLVTPEENLNYLRQALYKFAQHFPDAARAEIEKLPDTEMFRGLKEAARAGMNAFRFSMEFWNEYDAQRTTPVSTGQNVLVMTYPSAERNNAFATNAEEAELRRHMREGAALILADISTADKASGSQVAGLISGRIGTAQPGRILVGLGGHGTNPGADGTDASISFGADYFHGSLTTLRTREDPEDQKRAQESREFLGVIADSVRGKGNAAFFLNSCLGGVPKGMADQVAMAADLPVYATTYSFGAFNIRFSNEPGRVLEDLRVTYWKDVKKTDGTEMKEKREASAYLVVPDIDALL